MRALLASSAAALIGCSSQAPELSSDISTRDMSLYVYADGGATGTDLRVSLTGPDTALHLADSDRLELLAESGARIPLRRNRSGDYTADLAPGTVDLLITLTREAPEASVALPIPVPPATPLTVAASASRAAPIDVTWTPGKGAYKSTLDVTGTCIPPISRPLSIDVGKYTLQPADLQGSADTCDVTVTLTRELVDQRFGGVLKSSYLSLERVVTTHFECTP